MDDPQEMDDRVMELRRQGNAFGVIAKTVGLSGAREALEAFQRVLRNRPPSHRALLRAEELRRLETIAERLEARSDLTGDQRAEALRALAHLRQVVLAG